MTVTMSTEGESVKSGNSEPDDKKVAEQNTDSSQDSQDVKDAKSEKASMENNVEKADKNVKEEIKTEDESSKSKHQPPEAEKKTENDSTSNDEKPENDDTENVKTKKSKKEVESEEKSEDTSAKEDEDDKEKEVPLLDQPLEKSGKRERKNVQRFNEEFSGEPKDAVKVEFSDGSGTPLGEIPRIDASISRFKNDDLKILHRILFKTTGKSTMVKKNIKKFNGFDFKKESDEYTKKIGIVHKMEVKQLKSVCEMLDLPKSGSKDELVSKIVDFLIEPKDSGKSVDGGRPKRSAAVKANNRGYSSHDDYSSDDKHTSRARRDKGKRTNLKDDSSSDEEFQPNQSDGSEDKKNKRKRKNPKKKSSEEDDDDVSEGSVEGTSSEESDDEPKAKRRKGLKPNNKIKAKATPGKRGRPPASAKKTPSRTGKKAKTASSDEESDHKEDSSSEDEPLVKKAKSSEPPTDDEIKTFIKNILEGANLEEITMKTVCQRVYGNYPDFDLTHKKDFIKSTVRSLIST